MITAVDDLERLLPLVYEILRRVIEFIEDIHVCY